MSGLQTPTVSVVMPLYEKGETVARALASVLGQSYGDFELVVVDDGSTDGGPATMRACTDPRVRVVRQPNAGVAAARNRGIAAARADLVAFLDADDRWEPDFLATVLRLRSKYPHCAMFATRYTVVSPDGRTRPSRLGKSPPEPWEGVVEDYFALAAATEPPVWTSAVAITRSALARCGGFENGVTAGEDLLLWARVAATHDLAYCSTPKASFWPPPRVNARPGRLPQVPDRVGRGLAELLRYAVPARRASLRRYVALWHRMRGVVWMHAGNQVLARAEFASAARLAASVRLAALYALTLLPGRTAVYRLLQR